MKEFSYKLAEGVESGKRDINVELNFTLAKLLNLLK